MEKSLDPDPDPDPNPCSDPGTDPKPERSDSKISTASVEPRRDCILGGVEDFFSMVKSPDPDPDPDPNPRSDPGTDPKPERSDSKFGAASVVPRRDCILGGIKDFFLMKKSSDPDPDPDPNPCSDPGTDPRPERSDSKISATSVEPRRDCILVLNWYSVSNRERFYAPFMLFVTEIRN
jgi:hypothetical protein